MVNEWWIPGEWMVTIHLPGIHHSFTIHLPGIHHSSTMNGGFSVNELWIPGKSMVNEWWAYHLLYMYVKNEWMDSKLHSFNGTAGAIWTRTS